MSAVMTRWLVAAAAAAGACAAVASRGLPEMSDPASWSGVPGKVAVSAECGMLDVSFTAARGDGPLRIVLERPVRLERGENLLFDCCMSRICPMMVLATAVDADGRHLRFKTRSMATLPNGIGGWGATMSAECFAAGSTR